MDNHQFMQTQVVILEGQPYQVTTTTVIQKIQESPSHPDRYTAIPYRDVWEVLRDGNSIDEEDGGRILRQTEEQARTEAYRLNHPEDKRDD